MYRGAAPSPFSAGGEGEILFFNGKENCPEHSNYISVLGKIYWITVGGGLRGRRKHLPGPDGGEMVLQVQRAPPMLLLEPEALSLC